MSDLLATLQDPRFPPAPLGAAVEARASLRGEARADVCIIGAGYTGLSAALHLARAGVQVVVLEAWRAGHGASGRNGGQVLAGQRRDQVTLEAMVGAADARRLWQFGQDAVALVKRLIAEGDIACDLQPGAIEAGYRDAEVADLAIYGAYLASHYGYEDMRWLDRAEISAVIRTDRFAGGLLDMGSAHLNPFAYAQGLARMAEAAGAVIHEESRATRFDHARVETDRGHVLADHIVLACNGYLGGLHPPTAAHVMPINNYIAITEPLAPDAVMTARHCVADTKHVVNYFRTTADHRLVFGGGESYGHRFPRDIAAKVRRPLGRIFPHLKDVRIDAAWGGTLAITPTRMPHLARQGKNLWISCGYSGHGVATATLAGAMIAQSIQGDSEGFETMSRVPTPRFPGGTLLRWPILTTAMAWFSLRDRLGF